MNRVLMAFLVFSLPLLKGADSTYQFTLHEAATLNGTQLKPGDYRLVVDAGKGRIRVGKIVIEAPLKIETGERKFRDTSVTLERSNAGLNISEIDIGGSTKRIVFGVSLAGQ